jgi:hypothetical protein
MYVLSQIANSSSNMYMYELEKNISKMKKKTVPLQRLSE